MDRMDWFTASGRDDTLCEAHGRDRQPPNNLAPTLAGVGPPLFASVPGSGLNDIDI